jgi:type VI secretion system secreted protein VgrG
MEEEGWFSYFEQKADGAGHSLVITDTAYRCKPLAPQQIAFHGTSTDDELHKIASWSASRRLASSQLTARTDDYKSPYLERQSNTSVFAEHGNLPRQLEVYEYTGAYTFSKLEQGNRQTRIRVEEWESSMKRFEGVSGSRTLRAGSWFTLVDHPAHRSDTEEERQFLVIAVEWAIENNLPLSNSVKDFPGSLALQLDAFKAGITRNLTKSPSNDNEKSGNGYTGYCFNRFEVQRRKIPFRSPSEHPKPELYPQTAIVVGPAGEEIHTDHLNRVKVRFRWDRQNPGDEKASCWLRVSYPNAGEGWGAVNVPRTGQEVIVTFLGGNADRPVITGRLYNEAQAPQWHSDGKLSGFKSKEYKGSGFNQLVLDDTTGQNRVHLYSTNTHAQLNLGYLVTQNGNERSRFYGSGFALSTDAFGAIVTNKGLYLSTFGRMGAQGTQLDANETTTQLKAGASLTKMLSDTASKAGAEPLDGQAALDKFIDNAEDRYESAEQQGANRFKEPILLAGSPSGIGFATTECTHIHAGAEVTLSSGKDTNLAIGKSLIASVAEKISLFAENAGLKLFAAKGKVDIQAQGNDLDIIAEKVVRLLSTTARIEIHAKEEVVISAGGSSIKINGSGITESTPGKWTAQASMHLMPGPAKAPYVMPHLPKAELEKTDLEFRHLTNWGEPLAGAAYKAVLSDGSIRRGTLDALGVARISDVPPGGAAKIEYDYKPMQASSTVSTELDDDVHELLNWIAEAPKKGDA